MKKLANPQLNNEKNNNNLTGAGNNHINSGIKQNEYPNESADDNMPKIEKSDCQNGSLKKDLPHSCSVCNSCSSCNSCRSIYNYRKSKRTPQQKYLLNLKLDKVKVIVLQIAVLVGFFGLWELLAVTEVIDSFIMSSPSRIAKMFTTLLKQDIFMHIRITLTECILSFVISTVLGCIIAVLLWWSQTARRVSEPFIVVINSLPKIALGPIIIVWMGVGMKAIVVMGILICIVVTIISVLNGFLSCDQGKILLLQSMGASKLQIFFKLVFPNSIPNLLSVLKINVGLAWVGTIMGEYLVSGAGLGYLIIYGGQVFKLDLVMTSTLILCMLAALMYLSVAIIEKRINKHRL